MNVRELKTIVDFMLEIDPEARVMKHDTSEGFVDVISVKPYNYGGELEPCFNLVIT